MWTGLYLCFASIPWTTSSKQVEARNHRVDMCSCQDQEHQHCRLSTPLLMKFEAAKRHQFLTLFWCPKYLLAGAWEPILERSRPLAPSLLFLARIFRLFPRALGVAGRGHPIRGPQRGSGCTCKIPRWLSSPLVISQKRIRSQAQAHHWATSPLKPRPSDLARRVKMLERPTTAARVRAPSPDPLPPWNPP